MSWRYRRGRNWFGAGVLIAVGVVGLLVNFNIVSVELLDQFWKLWPLIPLAIGISILIGRRRFADAPSSRDAGKD